MSTKLIIGARSGFVSKLLSSLTVFAMVVWTFAPGLGSINFANAATPVTYYINQDAGSPVISGMRVTLAGTAGTSKTKGQNPTDQTVCVDWGTGAGYVNLKSNVDSNDEFTIVTTDNTNGGVFTATWTAGYTYSADGTYTILAKVNHANCSGSDGSDAATITIGTVVITNAPVANNGVLSTNEDTSGSSSVTATDSDVGDTLTYTKLTDPLHGTISGFNSTTGAFTYTPAVNYTGSDSFTFKASDGTHDSNTATISITVNPVNDAPVANNGSITINEDTPISSTLTSSDIDGVSTTYVIFSGPAHGSISGFNVTTGDFTYTPSLNYNGSDSFMFRVNDGAANSNDAEISITVNPANDLPVANDDVYSTNEDTEVDVPVDGVLTNDIDAEGDGLTVMLIGSGTSNGTLTLHDDGSFEYVPDADFVGNDTFSYKAKDGTGNSNTATVTIIVNNTNDAPVVNPDSYSTNEDVTLNITDPGVLTNDHDVDADTLTLSVVDQPLHGDVTLNNDGSFSYVPDANYNGSDSFTYKANDGSVDSGEALVTITVNPVNDAPTVSDDSNTTPKNTAFSDNVTGADLDVPANTLTYSVVTDVANGTLVLNADGSFTYTPDNNYVGSDSFTFKVNDGSSDSNTGTFSITVTALPTFTLTVTTSGEGDGVVTSSDGMINCDSDTTVGQEGGTDCSETYELGTSVTLTATPDEGSNFDGTWSGACSGTAPCTLSISAAASANAHFGVNAVTPPPSGGGGGGGGGGVVIPSGGLVIPGSGGTVLGASTGPVVGQVLGTTSCEAHFTHYLLNGYGEHDTNSVLELQKFLNAYMDAGLELTGNYDAATVQAVRNFQQKEFGGVISPWKISKTTGHFYLTTLRMANIRYCELNGFSLDLPMPSLIPFKKGIVAGASTSR